MFVEFKETGTGTAIRSQVAAGGGRVRGVTSEADVWVLSGEVAPALEWLDARALKGRTLVLDGPKGMLVVPLQDVHGPDALKAEVSKLGLQCRDDLGTVSCVGTGLNADWSVMRRAMTVAKAIGLEVHGAHASSHSPSSVEQTCQPGQPSGPTQTPGATGAIAHEILTVTSSCLPAVTSTLRRSVTVLSA